VGARGEGEGEMLIVLLAAIVMLYMLDRAARWGRLDLLKQDARYQLFELRDEARRALINGEIPPGNDFDYFDTTLSRVIGQMDHVNVWVGAFLLYKYRNEELERPLKQLQARLEKPENWKLAELHARYRNVFVFFLVRRHCILTWLAQFVSRASRIKKQLVDTFLGAPPTSTLMLHYR